MKYGTFASLGKLSLIEGFNTVILPSDRLCAKGQYTKYMMFVGGLWEYCTCMYLFLACHLEHLIRVTFLMLGFEAVIQQFQPR